ncbi:hypothetical protein [Luteococcus sp.]|uniref:hypothetical protein n=1 Tax=Luteococcus sp. TaxID=1969402 RepID=UPI0037363334
MAASSIVHGGLTQATTTLFRRELVPLVDGSFELMPLVSGNALRSALRRTAAELFCDALEVEGALSPAVSSVLLNGGALTKSKAGLLTGARRALVRELVVPVGLFGAATSGVIVDGCVRASKLVPVCSELAHLCGRSSGCSIDELLQVEDYSRTAAVDEDDVPGVAGPMRYSVEVLCAGTQLAGQVSVDHASAVQHALMCEVLQVWTSRGTIGGRVGSGHGQISGVVESHLLRGTPVEVDWRAELAEHRDEVIAALEALS